MNNFNKELFLTHLNYKADLDTFLKFKKNFYSGNVLRTKLSLFNENKAPKILIIGRTSAGQSVSNKYLGNIR